MHDDEANKAIFAFGFSVFAYTGVAYVDCQLRLRIDDWFIEEMSNAGGLDMPFDARLSSVGSRMNQMLALNPAPIASRSLTFAGVGYVRIPPRGRRVAFYVRLTNIDPGSHVPNKRYWVKPTLVSQGSELYADGQRIPADELTRLRREIRVARKAGVSSSGIAQHIVPFVRKQARRYQSIGESVMVSYLPISSVNPGKFSLVGGRPLGARARFLFVPKGGETCELYGPNIVAYGMAAKDIRYNTPNSRRLSTTFSRQYGVTSGDATRFASQGAGHVRQFAVQLGAGGKPMRIADASNAKKARLEARITAEQKALIERAAAYEGRSVSDFVVATVQQAAKAVVREHEVLVLNESQSRAFVEALLNPPEPSDALRRAAEQYRRDVVGR